MKKRLLIAGLAVIGGLALVRSMGGGGTSDTDTRLVFDRLWIDRLPEAPKDTANVFIAVTGREKIGIFQAMSSYKGSYEIFKHTASGNTVRVVYPQTDEKENVKVRAWKCRQDDMDYCLELSGASRGVKRYHSAEGWEIGDAATAEELRDRAAAIVRHPK